MSEAMVFTSKVTVRYQETDQMGVAHHSVYPVWFEVGRSEFIRSCGVPYGKMESAGLYLPMVEMQCKFHSFSRYEDELDVMTRVSLATKTRHNFSYEVYREKTLIASGATMHIYANRELKPVNLQKYMPELYELFQRLADRV